MIKKQERKFEKKKESKQKRNQNYRAVVLLIVAFAMRMPS